MKKQMKLLLFALLVVLMVATLAICVSAEAVDGATIKEDGHFYEVVDKDGANATYYTKLQAAITAVTDGGKITVLADSTEGAGIDMSREGLTYTITGGTGTGENATRKTITFTGGSASTHMMYLGKTKDDKKNNGSVTIENITLASADNWQSIIYSTGDQWAGSKNVGTLTLRNVRSEIGSMYGIWFHQACNLVIEGEDTYMKNEYVHADFGKGEQILRTNTGAGGSKITITAGTFIGDFYLQTTSTHTYSNCEITGYFFMITYAHTVSWDNVTFKGYVRASVANNNITIKNSSMTFEGDATYGACLISTGYAFKSFTITDTAINISGAGKKLCDSESYGGAISITGGALTLGGGAIAPIASEYKTFTVTSATVTDTASFLLNQSGNVAIGTKAELVAAIKANAEYAYLTIPEAWHNVTMNNDALKVTLSGDALAQQSGETPFITATAGTLISIAKGVTTYTEGTHFFKTTIEGAVYYYETLEDAIDEVVNDGVIYLVANAATGALPLTNEKTFTIDGDQGKFTLTVTPAAVGSTSTTLFHVKGVDVTFKDLTFALGGTANPASLFFVQRGGSTNDPALTKLTLDNVDLQITSTYGIWLHQCATLTLKGENTKITGGSSELIRLNDAHNSVVVIDKGTYTAPGMFINNRNGQNASFTIKGGTINVAMQAASLAAVGSSLTMTGGTINSTAAEGAAIHLIHLASNNTTVTISGKDTLINGTNGNNTIINANNSGSGKSISITDATIDGAKCWIFSNSELTLNIAGNATFKDTNNTLYPTVIGGSWVGAFNINGANTGVTTINLMGGNFNWSEESTLEYRSFFYVDGDSDNGVIFNVGNFSTEEGAPAANIQFNTIAKIYAIKTGDYCTLAFNNASISGTKYYVLDLEYNSTATVDNCTINSDDKIFTTYGTAQLTVNSGNYTCPNQVIYAVDGTITINGGELTATASQAIAISGGILNIEGGTLKGTNNVVRTVLEKEATTITINISGGSLTNTGSANQLIRANSDDIRVVTINILPGANLVQNQNQYVIRIQTGIGIINMQGGTVAANGTFSPFLVSTGADSEFKMSGGTLIANCGNAVQMSAGKTLEITGGVIVMKNNPYDNDEDETTPLVTKDSLFSTGEDFTGTPVVKDAIILFNATGEFTINDGLVVPAAEYAPSVKFGGTAYSAFFSNAGSAINKAGAEIYMGLDEEGKLVDGIRFTSELSADVVELVAAALAAGKTVSYGTVIAPADYVAAAGTFTKAALDAKFGSVNGKLNNASVYVDIPADNSLRDTNKDGVYESFSGTLVNIKEANYGRAFAAVGYVVIDGEITYSAFNTVDNARSAKYVATVLLESGYYEGETEMIAILNKYAGIEA